MLQHVTYFLSRGVGGRRTLPHGRWEAEPCGSRSTGSCCQCPSGCSPASWSEHIRHDTSQNKWHWYLQWDKWFLCDSVMLHAYYFSVWEQRPSCVLYLVVWESDGCIKHGPEDALIAGGSGEGALVSEEMVEVLGEHGAHIDVRYVHGLTWQDRTPGR